MKKLSNKKLINLIGGQRTWKDDVLEYCNVLGLTFYGSVFCFGFWLGCKASNDC
jgi:hypothetical protein